MKAEITMDMVIPFWGAFTALVVGGFYVVKMKIDLDHIRKDFTKDLDQLSKDLKEIKELVHEMLIK